MSNPGALIFGGILFCTIAGVLYAFYWASRTGQMNQLRAGAETIFDRDEFIGAITDAFPDQEGLQKKDVTMARSLERFKGASKN